MVCITFQLIVLAALFASSSALSLSKRSTAADVKGDLTNITSQVTTLDNAIDSFPASCSLILALDIHEDTGPLVAAINQAASDINNISPSPVDEDDGEAIISQVQGIQPIIIDALNGIVSLKSEFDSCQGLDVSDLIVVDLQDLSSATSALETALIAAVPADLQDSATAIQTAVNAAFTSACAAYGSSC